MTNLKLSLITIVLLLASGCSTAQWNEFRYGFGQGAGALSDSINQPSKKSTQVVCNSNSYGYNTQTTCNSW